MKKMMMAAALFNVVFITMPALADDTTEQGLLGFGAGYYDFDDQDDTAVDFRLEYWTNDSFLTYFTPWAGVEATSDGALYGIAGLLYDWRVADHWAITPSWGVGAYSDGGGKDLGHVIEFRSQAELSYVFNGGDRVGMNISHISNADLDDDNPGANVIGVSYRMPVSF